MPKFQLSLDFIPHEENGAIIHQRAADGYINATAMCNAADKKIAKYLENKGTTDFLIELAVALSADVRIRTSDLVEIIKGGNPAFQGTWVHPQVAIHLAQWLSPKFAVRVSIWVHDWLNGKGGPQTPAKLPHHLDRYLSNESQIPPGFFSILQETALGLFGPLHKLGFDIPKTWVPDISVGRCFCAWLRKNRGVNTDALPVYEHDYLDGRVIDGVKLYPNDLLGDYRNWFIAHWLPDNGIKYFKQKDPGSLVFLSKLPALGGPIAPKVLAAPRPRFRL